MSKPLRDPNGVALKRVLLQIVDSDDQGPISLRVGRDHDKFDLSDERQRKFLIVWCAEDEVLGEMRITDLVAEFEDMKAKVAEREAQREQLDRDIDGIRRDLEALERENKEKTEALRQLQKERDPERVAHAIAQAVKERTTSLEDGIRGRNSTIADLEREIAELKASKKRLKEANERLKDGRK